MSLKSVKQKSHDAILDKYFLRFFPEWIQPNHLTVARFFLFPILIYLASIQRFIPLLVLFVFVAATDMLDGALARIRKKESKIGAIIDPLADKALMVGLTVVLVFQYVDVYLAWWLISVELLFILAAIIWYYLGKKVQANNWGKAKMILQVIGLLLLMLALITSSSFLLVVSFFILWSSVLSAIISGVTFLRSL